MSQLEDRGVRVHVAWRDQPTRRAVTFLEPGGERTIITLGERLQPRGSDELEWERLADAHSVYFTAGDGGALRPRSPVAVRRRLAAGQVRAREPTVRGCTRWCSARATRTRAPGRTRVASHARLLVATEGDRGGRWWGESEGRWAAAPLPGPPRDTYGCGDSFAAAFTLGLGRGDSIADAARLGAAGRRPRPDPRRRSLRSPASRAPGGVAARALARQSQPGRDEQDRGEQQQSLGRNAFTTDLAEGDAALKRRGHRPRAPAPRDPRAVGEPDEPPGPVRG